MFFSISLKVFSIIFENRCHESVPIRDVRSDMMALSETLSMCIVNKSAVCPSYVGLIRQKGHEI
jgi:hypothetical protein